MKRNFLAAGVGALAATLVTTSVGAVKASGRMAAQIRDQFQDTTERGRKIQSYKDLDFQIEQGNLDPTKLERAKDLRSRLEIILWPKAQTQRKDHSDIDSFLSEIEREFDLSTEPAQVTD